MAADGSEQQQWHQLKPLLTRATPFCIQDFFDPQQEDYLQILNEAKVLVVGAGGLGCEILKDLALSGIRNITVIDLDTVDVSNLNRQFLFRLSDVGKSKAEAAASFVRRRCPYVDVEAIQGKIQDQGQKFYRQFNVVIAGLDNVEARRWLNQTLNDLVKYDEDGNLDTDTVIPFIDGGTEGFKGQARLMLPKLTSCYECAMSVAPEQKKFNYCTIATVPRIPEHCIQYVREIEWERLLEFRGVSDYKMRSPEEADANDSKGAVAFDSDNPEHMSWIYNRAVDRAAQFHIQGVTYKLTMQVVKNIIPAIAATNAVVAAACVNEAVKVLTRCSYNVDQIMFFDGGNLEGCYLTSFQRSATCSVCAPPLIVKIPADTTFAQLRQLLQSQHELEEPDITYNSKVLYLSNEQFSGMYADTLVRKVRDVVKAGHKLFIAARNKKQAQVVIVYV